MLPRIPLSPSRGSSYLLVSLAYLTAACGTLANPFAPHANAGEAPPSTTAADPGTPAATPPGQQAQTGSSQSPASAQAYDDQVDHTVDLVYYKGDSRLFDLFSSAADSQLCWPAAMSYSMEYLRAYHQPAASNLPVPSPGDEAARSAGDIRYFTGLCKTSLQVGTTVPQAVACLESHMKAGGYTPSVQVTGLDAKWAAGGDYYPASMPVALRPVSTDDVRTDLKADLGVILLIGFYSYDTNTNTWHRTRGHFLTVTGYEYMNSWATNQITLTVVNPATDYVHRMGQPHYDHMHMQRFNPGQAHPGGTGFPENVAYQISDFPGTDLTVLVESAISFTALPNQVASSQNP